MAGKNILVMHGGGPTAVINASLYGIVAEGKQHAEIAHIYGAHGGPSGLVNGSLIDLGAMPDSELVRLRDAPGSAIGTGRDALAGHYPAMVELLIKNNIDIVMPTGGNGTMNTCALLQEAVNEAGADIQVIGVPKTMDNDSRALRRQRRPLCGAKRGRGVRRRAQHAHPPGGGRGHGPVRRLGRGGELACRLLRPGRPRPHLHARAPL